MPQRSHIVDARVAKPFQQEQLNHGHFWNSVPYYNHSMKTVPYCEKPTQYLRIEISDCHDVIVLAGANC